jgi:hypothetical protein
MPIRLRGARGLEAVISAPPPNRYSFPLFPQAPNPCEWVAGLGWRSHREATPAGAA